MTEKLTQEEIIAAWSGTAADAAKLRRVRARDRLDKFSKMRVNPERLEQLFAQIRDRIVGAGSTIQRQAMLDTVLDDLASAIDAIDDMRRYVEDLEEQVIDFDAIAAEEKAAEDAALDAAIAGIIPAPAVH